MKDFEMYASKSLYERFVDDYLYKIKAIQDNDAKHLYMMSGEYLHIEDVLYAHLIHEGKSNDEAYKESNNYKILKILNSYFEKQPYTEEELNHIYCFNGANMSKPYFDIVIKRYLYDIYGTKDVQEIEKKFEEERDASGNGDDIYKPFIKLLNQKFETKKDVEKEISDKFDKWFLKEFNCGGYALEVFNWVNCENSDHDVSVSRILENPSVRLLGETELKDDEYLVVFDASSYHFIKQKDGKFMEKMRKFGSK